MSVLCYHRIIEDSESNLFPSDGLSLTVNEFKKQMLFLSKNFSFVNLNNDVEINDSSILVTFDDGYADILNIVLPVIEQLNIPILIFITTSAINNKNSFFWWIDLWENLKKNSFVKIEHKEQEYFFSLNNNFEKNRCYNFLCTILINLTRTDQEMFFQKNGLFMYHEKSFLSLENLKFLSDHHLITIGYHSHNHLNFKVESESSIRNDLNLMHEFFNLNKISLKKQSFAFCHGILPENLILERHFTEYKFLFGLGFRELFNKKVISRFYIDSNISFNSFKLKVYFFHLLGKAIKYVRKL